MTASGSRIAATPPPRPRRVLFVMYGWNDSGGGTILPRRVAPRLAADGHEVSVFYAGATNDPARPTPYELREHREDGVRLFGVFNRDSAFMDADHPDREVSDPPVERAFEAVLAATKPDVVHVWNLHNLGMSLPGIARARGIPVVFSSNNYWAICPRLYLVDEHVRRCAGAQDDAGRKCSSCVGGEVAGHARRTAAAIRMLDRDLDLHLAVSARVKALYVQNGASPDHIRVLHQQPPTVDRIWSEVGAVRTIVDRLDRPLRVAYFGSILGHKGVHRLVQAAQAFPPGSLEVVLHGDSDLGYAGQLQTLDRQRAVRFGGRYTQDELPERLATCDVVVVPSMWEDCAPFVVAEALAARAVVIGSRFGGICEFFRPGENGLEFDPDDPNSLAAALARFFTEPELLGAFQQRIAPPRGFHSYVHELVACYDEVLAPASCGALGPRPIGVAGVSSSPVR